MADEPRELKLGDKHKSHSKRFFTIELPAVASDCACPTTVRHGSCRVRLKIRYDGAEIGEGPAGRFRLRMR